MEYVKILAIGLVTTFAVLVVKIAGLSVGRHRLKNIFGVSISALYFQRADLCVQEFFYKWQGTQIFGAHDVALADQKALAKALFARVANQILAPARLETLAAICALLAVK